MSEYDNSNRISLWLNDKREKQTHPHLRGQGETTEPVWGSAWFSKDLDEDDQRLLMDILKRHAAKSKKPFLSVSIKPKGEAPASNQGAPSAPEFEEVPF